MATKKAVAKPADPKPPKVAAPSLAPKGPSYAELSDARVAMQDSAALVDDLQRSIRAALTINDPHQREERVSGLQADLERAIRDADEASHLFTSLQKSARRSAHAY